MPNKIPSKVVILFSVLVLLFVGAYLWQRVLSPVASGGLVGVATADGPTYFGTLVLADKHSVVLRDVYTAAGYYSPPVEEGKPTPKPQFRVGKHGGGGPGGEDTLVLSRSRVLFISKDISSEAREAIKSWIPPTPPPPTVTPIPRPGEATTETLPPVAPTEAPTRVPATPRAAPGE